MEWSGRGEEREEREGREREGEIRMKIYGWTIVLRS